MRIGLAAATPLIVLGMACGTSVTYTPLNKPPHGRRPLGPGGPDIYMSQAPSRPYTEIGLLEAQQESAYSSDDTNDIIRTMRAEADRYGCEGIIIVGPNDQIVGGGTMMNTVGGTTFAGTNIKTLKGFRATCILYND